MRRIVLAVLIILPLISCSPTPTATPRPVESATPFLTVAPTIIPTSRPTTTSTATATITPPPTATVTREPAFAVAGLSPDQYPPAQLANEAIAQYAKAMSLKPESVGLKATQLKDRQGKVFITAVTQDGTPLLIATRSEEGEVSWKAATLRNLADIVGIEIGATAHYPIYGDELGRLPKLTEVLKTNFNALILEDHLRWNGVEQEQGTIDQTRIRQVQQLIAFAKDNNMGIVGQHLIYWAQYPGWLEKGNYTPDQVRNFVEEHITFTMRTFPEITTWVLVNEYHPVSLGWHDDYLQRVLGTENVLPFVFQAAQSVNPNATLLISDSYNETESGANYQRTLQFVNSLKTNGIRNVGVGLHMHMDGSKLLNVEEVVAAMQSYDVETDVMEADVNMKSIPPETPGRWEKQADIFAGSLRACIESPLCKRYFVWDPGDNASWLEIPNGGAGDWYSPNADATPFFDDLTPKPSYYAMLKVLFEGASLASSR